MITPNLGHPGIRADLSAAMRLMLHHESDSRQARAEARPRALAAEALRATACRQKATAVGLPPEEAAEGARCGRLPQAARNREKIAFI
jgi:hypothetical protein